MKYLKSFIACATITLITPTLAFAQEAGYWGYGSMCRARDCAPGREFPPEIQNIDINALANRIQALSLSQFEETVSEDGPRAESFCMEYARSFCGGVGYSTPNLPFPANRFQGLCTNGQGGSEYVNGISCPGGGKFIEGPSFR